MTTTTIRLGSVDENAMPANPKAFLEPYHTVMSDELKNLVQFRDEAVWRPFAPVAGTPVRELQTFLKNAGFMPKARLDGIFGYGTQAAVRLFQEYIRTVEKDPSIGAPDGIVGKGTWGKIEKWINEKGPDAKCEWAQFSPQNASDEFKDWINLLGRAKLHFFEQKDTHPIVKLVENYPIACDTKKVGDWVVDPNTIHLIGVRRSQESAVGADNRRKNDDLFVLLINGMVFKFWGSTDPSPDQSDAATVPFLVEGQHEYRFGWHYVSNKVKVYQAMRAKSNGVMVFRDNGDKKLDEVDISRGLEKTPNGTINIHWSGLGHSNYSAGCQVIAGNKYINHKREAVNCKDFAARNKDELGTGKTRAAYNMLTDLVLTYAPEGVTTIRYMLGRDETFSRFDGWNADFVAAAVDQLREGVA